MVIPEPFLSLLCFRRESAFLYFYEFAKCVLYIYFLSWYWLTVSLFKYEMRISIVLTRIHIINMIYWGNIMKEGGWGKVSVWMENGIVFMQRKKPRSDAGRLQDNPPACRMRRKIIQFVHSLNTFWLLSMCETNVGSQGHKASLRPQNIHILGDCISFQLLP